MSERRARKRSRSAAKQAGAQFEIRQAEHLRAELGNDYISRQDKNGGNDLGDIAYIGHRLAGVGEQRVPLVAEAKNTASMNLTSAMREAHIEAGNLKDHRGLNVDPLPVVIHKRHGVAAAGKQWVTMEVDTFIRILKLANP